MTKKGESTVVWWLGWIALTILTFFISCYFWTGFIAKHFGDMHRPEAPLLWVTAVFGTWLVLLVPLIIVMYNKVDRAYEDTRITRETAAFNKAKSEFHVRAISIEASKRKLPKELSEQLKKIPASIRRGHLVTAVLKDGRRFDHIFIRDKKELLGIYDQNDLPFKLEEVRCFEPADLDHLPHFETEKWLRLDGIGAGNEVPVN